VSAATDAAGGFPSHRHRAVSASPAQITARAGLMVVVKATDYPPPAREPGRLDQPRLDTLAGPV